MRGRLFFVCLSIGHTHLDIRSLPSSLFRRWGYCTHGLILPISLVLHIPCSFFIDHFSEMLVTVLFSFKLYFLSAASSNIIARFLGLRVCSYSALKSVPSLLGHRKAARLV